MWRQHSIMDTYDNANIADPAPPSKIHPDPAPISSDNDVVSAQMTAPAPTSIPLPAPTLMPAPTPTLMPSPTPTAVHEPVMDTTLDTRTLTVDVNLDSDDGDEVDTQDSVSRDQDFDQKVSMVFTTLFEIYRVLMSSLLLLFVPQSCGDEQCALSDKVFPDSGYEKFVACHNYVVMVMFFGFYALEIRRELFFINYLHTNRFKPRDNDSVEEALGQLDDVRKGRIEDAASRYKSWGYICMGAFVMNTVFSSVAIFNNLLDSKTITVLLTNVMFMSTKLNDVHTVSNTKKYVFLSSYLTRKVQFNDVDPDKMKTV